MTFCREEEKFEILKKHLDQDDFILVHLNPSVSNVKLPENYLNQATLTLKLSYYFQGKVEIEKDQIKASLLFDGNSFDCEIALVAIWGCTTVENKNYIWPENINPESYAAIASQMNIIQNPEENLVQKDENMEAKKEIKKPKPELKRIK